MSTCANCKELVGEEWSANNGLCDPCEMDRAVMTNYNERLDELISRYNQRYFYAEAMRLLPEDTQEFVESTSWAGELHAEKELELFKQALTSLIKELVAEAKPSGWVDPKDTDDPEWQGYVSGVNEFEQNLIKALEES